MFIRVRILGPLLKFIVCCCMLWQNLPKSFSHWSSIRQFVLHRVIHNNLLHNTPITSFHYSALIELQDCCHGFLWHWPIFTNSDSTTETTVRFRRETSNMFYCETGNQRELLFHKAWSCWVTVPLCFWGKYKSMFPRPQFSPILKNTGTLCKHRLKEQQDAMIGKSHKPIFYHEIRNKLR